MEPVADNSRREQALAFLLERIDYERALAPAYENRHFKLDRMRELLQRLGNPHNPLPIVHVAGTKGKGSSAAMIAATLSAAGYRTGLFSSPHLEQVEERLAVDLQPCTAAEFVELIDTLRPVTAAMDQSAHGADPAGTGPTYFELTTALALLHFARRRVDIAVLEVGLGGRLDSTNVCQPVVSVITSISFDHMKQLGNTLAAIAREKAGIIKPGVPVVSGVIQPEPRGVIEEVAGGLGCRLLQLERDYRFSYRPPVRLDQSAGYGRLDFCCTDRRRQVRYDDVALGLVGRHQAANAAVSLATLVELTGQGWRIPQQAIRQGLAQVHWPARVEVVGRRPTVVLDTAHNVASIEALLVSLEESFVAQQRILVFAATRDKDVRGILTRLLPRFDRVIVTRYQDNPRGAGPEELAVLAAELGTATVEMCPDASSAWSAVRTIVTPGDLVCITGSFYIAGEMRRQIASRPLWSSTDVALESA